MANANNNNNTAAADGGGDCTAEQLQLELLDAEKKGLISHEEIESRWEKAKEAIESEEQAASLYTTYIYMTRRHISAQGSDDFTPVDKLFQEAIKFLAECFGGDEDEEAAEASEASIRLKKNYAFFLYTKMRKPKEAREIWEGLLDQESGPFAWLEAISLERAYGGDLEHVRHLFNKALDAVTFRPHELYSAFAQFEREEGTREQLDQALDKIINLVEKFNKRAGQQQYFRQKQERIHGEKQQPQQAQRQQQRGKKGDDNKQRGGAMKKKQPAEANGPTGREKQLLNRQLQQQQHQRAAALKGQQQQLGQQRQAIDKQRPSKPKQQNVPPPPPTSSMEVEEDEDESDEDESDEDEDEDDEDEEESDEDEEEEEEKAKGSAVTFVTSAVPLGPMIPGMMMMPMAMEKEEKMEEKQVEAKPTMKKEEEGGMMKMEEENEAEQRMQQEEEDQQQQQKSAQKRKRADSGSSSSAAEKTTAAPFPFNTGLEKNKLFVKQLHFGCKVAELRQFFDKFGQVTAVRIVTKKLRDGRSKSKGCAYVEFATNEEAANAIMGADGAEIRGRKIAVYLSNPPPKKPRMEMDTTTTGGNVDQKQPSAATGANAVKRPRQESANKPSTSARTTRTFPPTTTSKMPQMFAPRALAAGPRSGRGGGSRLQMLPRSISKNVAATAADNVGTSAQSSFSPVGAVTSSTEEMNLGQQQQQQNNGGNNNNGTANGN